MNAALPEGFYLLKTSDGEVAAKDYAYRGKQYRQETLSMKQLLAISDLLFELDIKNRKGEIADVSDFGIDISITSLIRALVSARAHSKALAIVLYHGDGSPVDPLDFDTGTASEFLKFAEEVVSDFFTFNSDVSELMGGWFVRASGAVAGRLAGLLRRAAPYITSAVGISQGEEPSSTSGKRKRTSGQRKR